MLAETWYTSDQAVTAGLADTVLNDNAPAPDAPADRRSQLIRARATGDPERVEMETVEEILARMQVINDATDLTPALMDEYETLETSLAGARRAGQIRARQNAYTAPAPGQSVPVGSPRVDDTLERAFVAYLRTGQANQDIASLRVNPGDFQNAQSEGSTTAGGFTVPPASA